VKEAVSSVLHYLLSLAAAVCVRVCVSSVSVGHQVHTSHMLVMISGSALRNTHYLRSVLSFFFFFRYTVL